MPSSRAGTRAQVDVDTQSVIGQVDPRLFGGFVEHLGRAIYGGLYDPGSTHADETGLRTDVLERLRTLDFTILRYPGGNFASGYHWTDGVGPASDRKSVVDRAWNSLEPNRFGTDEFLDLCQEMDWDPMLAVNLGSGTADEAAQWVDYCSQRQPAVRVWCLGNEMDGDWQIGHTPVSGYIQRAREAASSMRAVDPDLELVACGSSSPEMSTWLEWDRAVLEALHDSVQYISLHRYAGKRDGDSENYLAITSDIDRQIESIDALCKEVAEKAGASRRVYLCFDEWNVWYRTAFRRFSDGHGLFSPPLIEEIYTLEDALVAAGFLNSFIRHADVVRIANLAQIVNAIAPLLTIGDRLLVQSIFWPFAMFSRRRRGRSVATSVAGPTFLARSYGETPWLDTSAIFDEDKLSLFLVNRGPKALEVELRASPYEIQSVVSAECLEADSLDSTNTLDRPDEVMARDFEKVSIRRASTTALLPGHSFTALTLQVS